jgi:hypothetical protein
MTATSKILLAAIIGAGVSLTPLSAQTSDSPNSTNPNTNLTHPYEEHHGTDWGWLGLGGLLGLLGLRRGATITTPTRDYGTNRT